MTVNDQLAAGVSPTQPNVKPEQDYGKTFKDNVEGMPEGERLPLNIMPKGPDPKPFKIVGG